MTQARTFLAGIRGANAMGGQAVVVDANGQLGVVSSSRRCKQDIQSMGDASNALRQLRPEAFHCKEAAPDGSKPPQYGLIAGEVAQVMPELASTQTRQQAVEAEMAQMKLMPAKLASANSSRALPTSAPMAIQEGRRAPCLCPAFLRGMAEA